jgi:Polysulphide reductase, NrfD
MSTHLGGTGYAAQRVTKAPDWHDLVAWDMLFNNLATGLFLAAALGDLLAPEVFTRVVKVAYPLALLFLIVDLICLVLDLGDPLRFHHMLRIFKPTSPMSLGTWCLTVFSLPLTAAAALSFLPNAWPAVDPARKVVVILGILPAIGSAVYKGVLLSTNSQPGWKDARWLGGYLSNSALMLGCAVLLALSAVTSPERTLAVLRPALGLLILLNLLVLYLLFSDLRAELGRVFAPRIRYIGAVIVVGLTLASLCLVAAGDSVALSLATLSLLLVQSVAIRFAIIRLPHL